jgi:hypothetical protein
MDLPPASTPIVCDLTTAPDTAEQRLAEYQRLFAHALTARERTPDGIRFRFRARPGVADWVHDLAAREKACCAFFVFDITTDNDEVTWDAAVIDNDAARAILNEFYALPDTVTQDVAQLHQRFLQHGLQFTANPTTPDHHHSNAGQILT